MVSKFLQEVQDKEIIEHENWITAIEIVEFDVDSWIVQHTKFYEASMLEKLSFAASGFPLTTSTILF